MNKLIFSAIILLFSGIYGAAGEPFPSDQPGITAVPDQLLKVSADAEFRPANFKTGDHVFCRLKVHTDLQISDAQTVFTEPSEWFYIRDIKVNHHTGEIQLWFIPLNPAEKFLPAVKTSNIEISGIPVKINPVLGDEADIAAIEGRVLLPWTRLLFAFSIASLLIIPLSFFFIIKRFLKPAVRAAVGISEKNRRKKLLGRLDQLIKETDKYESIYYCTMVCDILKKYLELTALANARCLTSEEIIKKTDIPAFSLLLCDSVRFGSVSAETGQLKKAAVDIYSYALSQENYNG